jgi:hypothetical protein
MYPGYPGYPSPAIYPPADMYPSGVIYPGMDMYDPYLERGRPIIGGGLIHRPAVVSDRSDRTVEHINISNNNQNIREEVGSGNVVVNQGKVDKDSVFAGVFYKVILMAIGLFCVCMFF